MVQGFFSSLSADSITTVVHEQLIFPPTQHQWGRSCCMLERAPGWYIPWAMPGYHLGTEICYKTLLCSAVYQQGEVRTVKKQHSALCFSSIQFYNLACTMFTRVNIDQIFFQACVLIVTTGILFLVMTLNFGNLWAKRNQRILFSERKQKPFSVAKWSSSVMPGTVSLDSGITVS